MTYVKRMTETKNVCQYLMNLFSFCSENEVKNRFNSTIRKRKLAETNGKLGYGGPSYTSDEDQDTRNEEEANSELYNADVGTPSRFAAKRMRQNSEHHAFRNVPKHPSRGYPSIPQGYSIISLSRDDLKALHIAEKLLKRIVSMDSPLHIVQLMSLLSMTHLNDISSTYSSLNMVPITNIADHEPQTTSSGMTSMVSSENEGPEGELSDQLRVDTGKNFSLFDQSAFQRLKSKKQSTAFRRAVGGSCLWAPAEDPTESQRYPPSALTTGSSFVVEVGRGTEAEVRRDPIPCQKAFYPGMQPRCRSPPGGESEEKGTTDISASLPVFEDEGISTSMWHSAQQERFKTDGNERDSDGDGGVDPEGDGEGYAEEEAGRDKGTRQ